MGSLYLIFGWGSPIGTGLFLVFLAAFIFILSKVERPPKK